MIKNKGATFIELVIAMVIIAISVTALISAFRIVSINSADPMITKQSVMIAESLMDEVMSKQITKPVDGFTGPFNVANRQKFDSLMDYNGFSMVGISSLNGTPISSLSNYSANISISNVAVGTIPSSDSYQITIQITNPQETLTFKGYRFNYE